MKQLFYTFGLLFFIACSSSKKTSKKALTKDFASKFAASITAKKLKEHVYIFASDAFEGRNTGEPGQKKAVKYLKDFYVNNNIASAFGTDNYYQKVPAKFLNKNSRRGKLKDSENVLGFIKGTEKPDEIVVISAHLDHEGVKNGQVYNGADDDASGSMAILEIAAAFKKAEKAGKGPKRSILFLHVTGEEKGLLGSKYYTENPIFPLANTVCNLNIDMIGRVDDLHKADSNYVYLIGSDRLSTQLHQVSDSINAKYTQINLDYRFNDINDPNRFYYRSDHYNFAKHNIPVIFYFNGTHEDYHKPTDTPDKIEYDLLAKRTRLIFHTAWGIANRKQRLVVDKVGIE
ncbi:M28 family metallopeptidase [uncultured Polaribacter sp.]|uniref:M28 family metallopeptidase n=1 Tax=uncultured Polaribacter sp. TaxID=174711 RepID=UPI00262FB3FC|nr:M28 family metallopeptidase [uncultured Polaribacter sp.]